jgi:hypothetical protein
MQFLRAFLRALRAELTRAHPDDALRRQICALVRPTPGSSKHQKPSA